MEYITGLHASCQIAVLRKLTTQDGNALSGLTFGTMQFGGRADERASRLMYDAARAAGVNHFDTAMRYNDGASEAILGRLTAQE